MVSEHNPLNPPWPPTTDEVRERVVRSMDAGDWGRYEGPASDELVQDLCEFFGVEMAYTCCSGTLAVELALRGLNVKPGDEVILAGYDFPGNFRAIEALGARPVLVDLAPNSWSLSVDEVLKAASSETKAVIASHLHGTLVEIERLVEAGAKRGFAVLEDVCQCPGARWQERRLGSFGDAAVLSFGGSKLLSSGRGGAVLTSRADVAQRIRVFAERGNLAFPLSELQAAVLIPQIQTLDERGELRRDRVRWLAQSLERLGFGNLGIPTPAPSAAPDYYKVPILVADGATRERVAAAAQALGVPLAAGFRGFAKRSRRRCRVVGEISRSQVAADSTLLLHHPVLLGDESTMEMLVTRLQEVLVAGGVADTEVNWKKKGAERADF